MEEELELFKELEEEKDEDSSLVINGDVILSINNYGGKTNLKTIRSKITKTLKRSIKRRDSQTCLCCGRKFENHLQVHHIMPLSKYRN